MNLISINYSFSILLFGLGLYLVFASHDLMKKLFGLSIFQTSALWFYISIAKVHNANPPIIYNNSASIIYSNPLPHVLMLTAIVVGVTILSLGFSLIIEIKKEQDV